jgi:hypothetical protein
MKTITKSTSSPRPDASLDATLNPVELSPDEIVAWGTAFPRPAATAKPNGFATVSNTPT